MNTCSDKQKTTLLLFAQNYSLSIIANKMGVHTTTIEERLRLLAKNHQKEFNNALGIREAYIRNKDKLNLKHIQHLTGSWDRFEELKQLF